MSETTKKSRIPLSEYIEMKRKGGKMTKFEMADVMGIDRNAYTRRLKGDGFTDREIQLAMQFFGEKFVVQKEL